LKNIGATKIELLLHFVGTNVEATNIRSFFAAVQLFQKAAPKHEYKKRPKKSKIFTFSNFTFEVSFFVSHRHIVSHTKNDKSKLNSRN
jgi:hypothetical protein